MSPTRDRTWHDLLAAAEAARQGRRSDIPSGPDDGADADLTALYAPLIRHMAARPLTIGQLGQSLDGRIATVTGDSYYVTGEANRLHLHRLRALVDAVLVGAGTVLHDDPQLTVRACAGANPTRVVIDSRGQLGADYGVFRDREAPTLVFRGTNRDADMGAAEVLGLEVGAEGYDPAAVLARLRERGLRHVLIEGGGVTVSRFLAAEQLDRLHVCVAPLLIGSGRPAVTLPEIRQLREARRPATRVIAMHPDTLFDCDLAG
jgi:riboflavin-specific deaminase-like protein